MDEYNFLSDLLDTYQSLSDWLKLVWAGVVVGFPLGLIGLFLHYRFRVREMEQQHSQNGLEEAGKMIYSIRRGSHDQLYVIQHDHDMREEPALILLDPLNPDPEPDR